MNQCENPDRVAAVFRLLMIALTIVTGSCAAAQPAQNNSGVNVAIYWNQVALDAIRITRTSPPVASRALAIAHTCMFDAWAAYDEHATGTQLGGKLRRPQKDRTPTNKEKAVSIAAYRALVDVFPSQKATLLDPALASHDANADIESMDPATPAGIANTACRAVLEFRHHDGSNQNGDLHDGAYSDYTGFTPANTVGVLANRSRWQPLLVNGSPQRWMVPQWSMVAPFALASGAEFRGLVLAQGPYLYPSAAFWKQAGDVVELSGQLGDREKVIAEFWADGAGTVTPPGHWNVIAQEISRRDHHTLDQDVQMFFVLNNALFDAGIAAWDAKRYTDSIRPVTVIRALMGDREMRAWAGPGLGVRPINCKNFRTYLPTPPFASFVSGHSTFSAAGAEILKLFTGSDVYGGSFTAEPGSSLIEVGLTPAAAVRLSWASFSDAADEAGMSRRFGGIHFESDDLAGRALGRRVADKVWEKAVNYIHGATQ